MNLLKVIFIVLVLVTIGELGYYFYIQGSTITPQANPQPVPATQAPEEQTDSSFTPTSQERLFTSENLKDLEKFLTVRSKTNSIKNAYFLVAEDTNKIGNITFNDDKTKITLTLVNNQGDQTGKLTYEVNTFKNLLYKNQNGRLSLLSLEELKIGNLITYRIKMDVFDPYSEDKSTTEFIVEDQEK